MGLHIAFIGLCYRRLVVYQAEVKHLKKVKHKSELQAEHSNKDSTTTNPLTRLWHLKWQYSIVFYGLPI